uniref:Uncharacterized protein n=1 Tax=Alexandrium monilatum TaxID=311494 RepID=A0A7S4SYJ6_9DINO
MPFPSPPAWAQAWRAVGIGEEGSEFAEQELPEPLAEPSLSISSQVGSPWRPGPAAASRWWEVSGDLPLSPPVPIDLPLSPSTSSRLESQQGALVQDAEPASARGAVFERLYAEHAARLERRAEAEAEAGRQQSAQGRRPQDVELGPGGLGVFQRLYEEHTLKRARQAEAEAEAEAKARTPCAPRMTPFEAECFYRRLHDEAWQREWRLDRQRQLEGEIAEMTQELNTVGVGVRPDNILSPPRWKQLYRTASLRERRLEMKRRKAQDEQERWLEETSIHRSANTADRDRAVERLYSHGRQRDLRIEQKQEARLVDEERWLGEVSVHRRQAASAPAVACERLYEDGRHRELRMEKLKEAKFEDEARRQAEESVHPPAAVPAEEVLDGRTRCLYGDALDRRARLEFKRRLQEATQRPPSRVACSRVTAWRAHLLYDDASRREEARRLRRAQLEEEEFERFQAESVHAAAIQRQLSSRAMARRPHRSLTPRGGLGRAASCSVSRRRAATPPRALTPPPRLRGPHGLAAAPVAPPAGVLGGVHAMGAPLLMSQFVGEGMHRAMIPHSLG